MNLKKKKSPLQICLKRDSSPTVTKEGSEKEASPPSSKQPIQTHIELVKIQPEESLKNYQAITPPMNQ